MIEQSECFQGFKGFYRVFIRHLLFFSWPVIYRIPVDAWNLILVYALKSQKFSESRSFLCLCSLIWLRKALAGSVCIRILGIPSPPQWRRAGFYKHHSSLGRFCRMNQAPFALFLDQYRKVRHPRR